jgi:hypothetical protein
MGTVSDAGPPCPAITPFCLTQGASLDAGLGYCAQCAGYSESFTCDAGACPHGGSAFCQFPVCHLGCN